MAIDPALETVLAALAACSGMDVVGILGKEHAAPATLEIQVSGERAPEHPKVFTRLHLRYVVSGTDLQREHVERAVALSQEKYCSVAAMLRSGVAITYETVAEAGPASGEERRAGFAA